MGFSCSRSFGVNYLLLRPVPEDLKILLFAGPLDFEEWLEANAADSPGIWLKIAKKGAPEPSVTYAEALELALCFGWIDSQKRGLDDTHFLQRFTPRRPRGRWSKINREKAEVLIEAGERRPAGVGGGEGGETGRGRGGAFGGGGNAQGPPPHHP